MHPNNEPKLAILIPTYNRAECLDLCLSSIERQFNDEMFGKIEVIVSDNASTDDTSKVLNKYEHLPYLSILKSEMNLGPDANFVKLVNASTAKFLWLFGDDEAFLDSSLEKILSILNKYPEAGLFHLTAVGHTALKEFNFKLKHPNPELLIFNDANIFLDKINYNISFISSHIFNKHLLNDSITVNDFLGTNLIQQLYYFQTALIGKYNIFINDYYFSQLLNNTGGYNLFRVFAENQNKIFNFFEIKGLKKKTIYSINKKMLSNFFPYFILQTKLRALESKIILQSPFRILFKTYWEYPSFWIFCFPILVTPKNILKWIYLFLKKTKEQLKGLGQVNI